MLTIATICARGGSRGVPHKNIRPLLGKPLIVWTIEQALAVPEIDKVFVSTDSVEIARIAQNSGAEVPFLRPGELAGDNAPKLPVIIHLVDHLISSGIKVDRIVDLDPTSPLRTISDIQACLSLLDNNTDVVITAYPAEKNPYFNMVEFKENGKIGLVKPPSKNIVRRQDAPKVYAMNASIYVWHRYSLRDTLWDSRINLYIMPRERSVDIDSEIDFRLVELLMKERQR